MRRERRGTPEVRTRPNGSARANRTKARAAGTTRDGPDPSSRTSAERSDDPLVELQRRYGNRAVRRLVTDETQTKLTVGPPDDRYEREADRVAAAVTGPPTARGPATVGGPPAASVQRMCPRCRRRASAGKPLDCPECEREVQRKEDPGSSPPARSDATPAVGSLGSGRPLPDAVRSYFEPRFGADFGDVRIHTGSFADDAAVALNARAFTTGRDVGFRAGEFRPDTPVGRELIAHELTHVVQQRRTGSDRVQRQPQTADPGDCTYGEHRRLQDAVDAACKLPRSCNSQQALEEIERRIARNAACIAARQAINSKCYRGGDPVHREVLQIAVETLIECQRVRERKLEREREKEPKVDPEAARRVGIAAAIGAGAGAIIGGLVGGLGGGAGGTLVAPGVGTVGGAVAGGAAGAAEGAAIGGIVGGAVGGGVQALIEWLSD